MNVVRHDHVLIHRQIGIPFRKRSNGLINDLTDLRESYRNGGRFVKRPYGDIGEDAAAVLGADGDEIRAGRAVIVIPQANLFSFRLIHGAGLPVIRRGDPCGRPLFVFAQRRLEKDKRREIRLRIIVFLYFPARVQE